MKSILGQLSKQYIKEMGLLTEIDPKKPVSFCNVQHGVWQESVQRAVTPSGLHIPGKVRIKDPFAKKDKMLMIIYAPQTDQTIIDGKEVTTGAPEYVRFADTGLCVCQEEDIEKYYFLMVHNKRRDNPFRLGGVSNAARFYMVDEERDAFKFVATFDYQMLAGKYMQDAEEVQLMMVAKNINDKKVHFIDLNKPAEIFKQELVKIIQQDPLSFLMATKDKRFRFKVLLDHELGDHNILWEENKRFFYWRSTGKEICTVAEGNKPQLALLDFVCGTEEGAGIFANELKLRDEKSQKILAQ